MKKIIIGIPTFNRKEQCFKLINKISSLKNIFDYIDLFIIDNSDKDIGALNKLLEKLPNYKNITYINNKGNKGLDWSILSLINFAKNKSAKIWFLSDDDTLFLDEIIGFIEFVNNSNSPVNLCKFDFKTQKDTKLVSKITNKIDAYKRSSFLPTVAIDPKNLEIEKLWKLCGTNYIHIAVINSLITSCEEIKVYPNTIGIQTENKKLTFKIKDTFLEGYLKCLKWQNVLTTTQITEETSKRIRGYLVAILKNKIDISREEFKLIEILKLSASIYKFLGILHLIKLAPIILLLFINASVKMY